MPSQALVEVMVAMVTAEVVVAGVMQAVILVQGAAVVVTPGQVTAVAPAMGTAQMQAVLVTVVPT